MAIPFRHILAPPVFADDEDKTHIANLLHTVFLGTIGLGVILSLLMLILQPNPLPHLIPMGIWLLLALSGIFFLRRGYVTATGLVFTIFTWLFVTLFAVISGGIRAPVLASYMVVILLTSLIYSARVGIVFVGLSVAAGIGLLSAELNGSLPPPLLPDNSVMMGVGFAVIFTYAAILVYLVTFSISNALERARRQERALQAALETLQLTLEAQQQSEANFRALADNANDGIIVLMGDSIVYANQHAAEIGGYSSDELRQKTIRELIHPAEYEGMMDLYQQWLAEAPVPLPYELTVVHKMGHSVSVEVTLARTNWEGQPAALTIFRDVTNRRQAEETLQRTEKRYREALKQSEKKFRNIVEAMPLGMHMYRLETGERLVFTGANPAADKILGIDHNQFIGKTLEEAFPGLIKTEIPEKYHSIAAEGGTWQTEEIIYQEGYIDGVFEVRAFQTSPGQVVATFLDISARRRVEERLGVIYQLGQELTLLRDETKIIRQVLETAADILQASMSGCGLVNELTGELEYYYRTPNSPDIRSKSIPLSKGQPLDVGWAVISNRQTIHVPDMSQNTAYAPIIGDLSARAELCVLMQASDRSLGVLYVVSTYPNYFTPADEQLLQTLADQTAVTLENAWLYQKLRQGVEELVSLNTENIRLFQAEQERYREAEALRRAALALTSTIDLGELLGRILMELQAVIPYDSAAVQLLENDYLEIIAGQGFAEPLAVIGTRIPLQEGFSPDYQVISSLKPVIIPDTTHSSPLTLAPVTPATTLIRSWLGVPLVFKNRAIGMLTLDKHEPDFYNETHGQTAEAYAAQAAIALENARLYQDLQNQMLAFQGAQAQLVQSERMAALGRLMASIAHEINNPLQGILGFLSLLGEELNQRRRQEKIDHYLDVANREIERIANIVHRMREFYRLPTTGTLTAADSSDGFYHISPAEMQAVDLHQILESVLQLANKKLQHSRVVVERMWGENLPHIQASPDHLKQVFLNLTLNAVDAMQAQGGTLSICSAPHQAQFYDSQPQPAIRIEFRDTGTGIPSSVLAHLFEPFISSKEYGSGLGLFTSYQIITAHRGQITAASQPGQGTTFTILLPVEQPPD